MVTLRRMDVVLFAVICALLMLVGLVGNIAPFIPGIPVAWAGFFIYALGTGFEKLSVTTVVVFFVIGLLLLILDVLMPAIGAKKYRASRWGVLGAFIGSIAGIFIFGFWGIIIGPFLGAFLFELLARKEAGTAAKSALGTLVGFLTGGLLKTIYVLIMAGFFIASLF